MISDIKQTGLLEAFNQEGHYYTSYPSLNHWTEDFQHEQYKEALAKFHKPLHLYLHIPFCAKLCYYCICNIVVSNDRAKIQFFLDHLLKEIDLLKTLNPNIRDLHFGGGTPSHLDQKQFSQLCDKLASLCDLQSLDEVAMEIDPRTVTQDDLRHYASCGVTRISFGVQDFDPKVQEAINRVQPAEMIEALLTPEIRSLFRGVNFDLLYGLPHQTHETVRETIKKVIKFRPERITLLKYCHAPEVRKHMKLINVTDLPTPNDLPLMFVDITQSLMDAGYLWIGLDHFCLPTDSLASKTGRTFNGFTSGSTEMIGLGPTSTGVFGDVYCQAHYDLNEYYDSVINGRFPILRGYRMSDDDLARRGVIFSLLCRQQADITGFHREINVLKNMQDLCALDGNILKVTTHGRVLLRNICKVFDVKDVKPEHHRIAQRSITRKIAA